MAGTAHMDMEAPATADLERIAMGVYEVMNPGREWLDAEPAARQNAMDVVNAGIAEILSENQTLKETNRVLNDIVGKFRDQLDKLTTIAEQNIARSAALNDLHPQDARPYSDQICNVFLTQVFNGLKFSLGLSPQSVTTEFRDMMDKIVTEEYPKGLRRSALRQIIEGDLTQGRSPVSAIPIGLASRVARILGFVDACETVLYRSVTAGPCPDGSREPSSGR